MTPVAAKRKLDDLLAGPLGRQNFAELLDHIYDSYATVDLTDSRIRQMEADLAGLSGEEARDLAERLGVLHFARGNYEAAAEKLKAVRTRKTALHFLGRALLTMGREREALDCLVHGRSGDDDVATDVLTVEAYCVLREPEEAQKVLQKYKPEEESSAGLLYARGRLADLNGEYGEAMELYEAALEQDPNHAESLFHLAQDCDLNGEDERAMEIYRRCAGLRPTFVGALMNLGILLEDHGMYYDAIDCYKRVLAIDPRHKAAQLFLKDAESSVSMYVDIAKSRRRQRMEEIFGLPVSGFELSSRSRNALERRHITTLGGLTRVTRDDLLNEKNFGDTSLEEIEHLLARYDLAIGEGPPGSSAPAAEGAEEPAEQEELNRPVEALDLSTRCRKCMERLGVRTIGELVRFSEEELLAAPNFGSTSLNEINTKLTALGLALKAE